MHDPQQATEYDCPNPPHQWENFYVIVHYAVRPVVKSRWHRYGEREFKHVLHAKAHMSALQREYPGKSFGVRKRRRIKQ